MKVIMSGGGGVLCIFFYSIYVSIRTDSAFVTRTKTAYAHLDYLTGSICYAKNITRETSEVTNLVII